MATIAVVDDDPTMSRLVGHVLRERGHSVVCFEDGAQALLAYAERWTELDAVISDVNMPRLDGVSLCNAIRDQVGKESLPVLLMSSLESEEDILRGLEAGADDYVVKPFSPAYLLAKLEVLLKHRRLCPNTPTQELALLQQQVLELPHTFDRYVLNEVIGEGGFSWVYAGRRQSDGLPVAVKILKPEELADRSTLSRYFREVSILAGLNSPHVVGVLGSGYAEGHFFLVMDRLEGETAHARVARVGPLSIPTVVRIGFAVSSALAAFAAGGLVHRDVKPANIILGPRGEVTLIDLGLAKAAGDEGLTLASELLGTAEYVAPEVISGTRESVTSDLYSLGVTLYELLTDQKPFGEGGAIAILRRVSEGVTARPVRELRPEVPVALSELVARLMRPQVPLRLGDPEQALTEFARLGQEPWMSEREGLS